MIITSNDKNTEKKEKERRKKKEMEACRFDFAFKHRTITERDKVRREKRIEQKINLFSFENIRLVACLKKFSFYQLFFVFCMMQLNYDFLFCQHRLSMFFCVESSQMQICDAHWQQICTSSIEGNIFFYVLCEQKTNDDESSRVIKLGQHRQRNTMSFELLRRIQQAKYDSKC